MRCTACGSEDLKEIKIIDSQVVETEEFVEQTVKSFACQNCRHVELYVDKEYFKKVENQEEYFMTK